MIKVADDIKSVVFRLALERKVQNQPYRAITKFHHAAEIAADDSWARVIKSAVKLCESA